jgi:3-oxoacyl-[acyl-carrier protein] reductase
MHVTVESFFLCSRVGIPHLQKARTGAIVMMAGVAANLGVQDRLHAVTANGALIAMAKSLAKEMITYNVTVNAASPGYIDTLRGTSAGSYPPGSRPTDNLTGRMGWPVEIASMVRTLCGPYVAYTTGQSLHINGGVYMRWCIWCVWSPLDRFGMGNWLVAFLYRNLILSLSKDGRATLFAFNPEYARPLFH